MVKKLAALYAKRAVCRISDADKALMIRNYNRLNPPVKADLAGSGTTILRMTCQLAGDSITLPCWKSCQTNLFSSSFSRIARLEKRGRFLVLVTARFTAFSEPMRISSFLARVIPV